jgi:hypothetical protein
LLRHRYSCAIAIPAPSLFLRHRYSCAIAAKLLRNRCGMVAVKSRWNPSVIVVESLRNHCEIAALCHRCDRCSSAALVLRHRYSCAIAIPMPSLFLCHRYSCATASLSLQNRWEVAAQPLRKL